MAKRRCYLKKLGNHVTAVRMDLMFDEFTYQKWDASQHGKPGDWLVNNNNDHGFSFRYLGYLFKKLLTNITD